MPRRRNPDDFPMTSRLDAPVDLAAEPDFALGQTRVRPSSRELVTPTQTVALEPRVMQVLVVLGASIGRTVPRAELLARCWGGVVVGEDALQRCIGRLRKVAELVGGFEIETLSRIGYRLHAEEPPSAAGGDAALRMRRGPLLAVLPFDDLPADGAAPPLGDGFADEILWTIGRRSNLRAVGRTSSSQFRGARKDVAEIERALGATHLLDGSVQSVDGSIRVRAHLMDLADQSILWSDRFDGRLDDLFALQDAVAAATVRALRGVFRGAQTRSGARPETFALIQTLRRTLSPVAAPAPGPSEAQWTEFERAAGDDAEAWGLLAVAYATRRWAAGPRQEPRLRDAARAAAQQALGLDPNCGAAHKALYLLEPALGRFVEIEQSLLHALAASPEDGDVCWSLYHHYLTVGRLAESFQAAENAYRVDPLHPPNALGYANALYSANRRAEAVALMRHTIEHWPEDPMVHAVALWTAAAAGEFDFVDAIVAQRRHERFPEEAQRMVAPAMAAVAAIRHPTADACALALERLEADISTGPPRFSQIGLCAYLGADLDTLYGLLERADFAALRSPASRLSPMDGVGHLFLRVNARLRTDARFVALCRRLGLTDYWLCTERWPECVSETTPLYDFVALSRKA
jgi:TolB-like protein/DNA-binding winged helix-turn-helix (wHTH) protein